MFKYLFLLSLFFFLAYPDLFAQTLNWVPLDTGITSGTCVSETDCANSRVCFGLEYTPAVSGRATSYTLGFSATCEGDALPNISATSCTMTDNTEITDGCSIGFGLFLIQPSGNNGSLAITAGVPVILHQICLVLWTRSRQGRQKGAPAPHRGWFRLYSRLQPFI